MKALGWIIGGLVVAAGGGAAYYFSTKSKQATSSLPAASTATVAKTTTAAEITRKLAEAAQAEILAIQQRNAAQEASRAQTVNLYPQPNQTSMTSDGQIAVVIRDYLEGVNKISSGLLN